MHAPRRSNVENLESRTLLAAHAFIQARTLEVQGDPQLPNIIDVEYTDASKTLISVSVSVIQDPAAGPTDNPDNFHGNFPAARVKSLYVRGGAAADTISVGTVLLSSNVRLGFNINTRIDTLGGDNYCSAGDENTTVNGGAGNDTITCGNGNDIIRGYAGDDHLSAGNGRDEISGGAGDDWIICGQGRATLSGGAGNDRIDSQDLLHGGDAIFGGAGDDSITAGNGNDSIWGGLGNDTIHAGNGHDLFGIGYGNDTCINGTGSSTFCTRNINAAVTDYDPPIDKLLKITSRNETKDPVI